MRGIARRLDRHRGAIEPGRQRAFGLQAGEDRIDMIGKAGVERHIIFQ